MGFGTIKLPLPLKKRFAAAIYAKIDPQRLENLDDFARRARQKARKITAEKDELAAFFR